MGRITIPLRITLPPLEDPMLGSLGQNLLYQVVRKTLRMIEPVIRQMGGGIMPHVISLLYPH